MSHVGTPNAEGALVPPVTARLPMKTGINRDERMLVRAAQRGEGAALEGLLTSHWDGAYRAALLISRDPAAAEDIAQESFIAALRSLSRFDRRRAFGPWLHRIATNRAIDAARASGRRNELLERVRRESVDAPGPEPGLSPALAAALGHLPVEDRAIVVLRHLFDYRSEEIGRMLGMPAGTVRRRLGAALAELRAELEEAR